VKKSIATISPRWFHEEVPPAWPFNGSFDDPQRLFRHPETCLVKYTPDLILRSGLAFPNRNNLPASLLKSSLVPHITADIAGPLFTPELGPCFRNNATPATLMTVPEAAMHEDHRPMLYEHDVRLPRQLFSMQSVSVTEGVQQRPDAHFRPSIPGLNRGHVPAALFRGVNIH
jgi:hypothetical protein